MKPLDRYSDEEIEEMRRHLEEETGLMLADLSKRGVVINYCVRHPEKAEESNLA